MGSRSMAILDLGLFLLILFVFHFLGEIKSKVIASRTIAGYRPVGGGYSPADAQLEKSH